MRSNPNTPFDSYLSFLKEKKKAARRMQFLFLFLSLSCLLFWVSFPAWGAGRFSEPFFLLLITLMAGFCSLTMLFLFSRRIRILDAEIQRAISDPEGTRTLRKARNSLFPS